jgi:NAD(P)-dependent dehydrogenase (short-subunit alcohol dehydrogenase family)
MSNALIWGATGGIGRALLEKLNAEGWTTFAVARDARQIDTIADYAFEAVFDNPSSLEQTVLLIAQEVDQIDLWIYAAGDIVFAKVSQMDPADWQKVISANLNAAFYTIHFSLPLLSEKAHIFFLGAQSERLRLPGMAAYAAAKAGMEAFVTAFGKEERKQRVTLVRPGAVATPFWDKVPLNLPSGADSPETVAQKMMDAYQSGHKGQLDLIAER